MSLFPTQTSLGNNPLHYNQDTGKKDSSTTPILFFGQPKSAEDVDEPTTYVDSSGDLTLLVQAGGKRKTFVVSSKAMCLASPVWHAMFDPKSHFKEANLGNKEASLEDDDPEALLLLLNIAHLQFLKVPQSLTFDQLLKVSILCDKYDVVTLVRPWLLRWLDKLKHLSNSPGYEEWLFIAWVFGDASTFTSIALRLVLEIKDVLFGRYVTGTGVPLGKNLPPGILGQ